MPCAICQTRRPKRFCPGVRGDICPICCGAEREVSIDCPLDCEYLMESRRHERGQAEPPAVLPNADIKLTKKALEEHEELAAFLGRTLAVCSLATPGAVDFDVRDALEGLIKTNRTLQSGVYYESVPQNTIAANIYRAVQEAMEAFRRDETKSLGVTRTRDVDILLVLVYFQRLELDQNNGRRRGRSFLHLLKEFYDVAPPEPSAASSLILP